MEWRVDIFYFRGVVFGTTGGREKGDSKTNG